jgi:hypothetical protein
MGKAQNTTRRLLPKSAHMVAFDLRAEARRLAPQALEVIEQALSSKDERTRLVAATIVLERGWGKPQVQVDAADLHCARGHGAIRLAAVPRSAEGSGADEGGLPRCAGRRC